MKNIFTLLIFGLFFHPNCNAEKLKKAYLDKNCIPHIVTMQGRNIKVTKDGRAMRLSISPNHEIAAWLIKDYFIADTGPELGPSELVIYDKGKIRRIECQQIIRNYWFWRNGENVAIDCGGLHFAGHETLYDVRTLEVIDSFDQADIPTEKRPIWSASRTRSRE